MATWPRLRPYDGEHLEPVPHLTLGANSDDLETVALAAEQLLPISSTAREVWLVEGQPDPPAWRMVRRYEFVGSDWCPASQVMH